MTAADTNAQRRADLVAGALAVLTAADPLDKVRLTAEAVDRWRRRAPRPKPVVGPPPDRPARLPQPALVPPAQVPRRRLSRGPAGRIALLHALAHIELNAVDLAWDMIARFGGPHDLPDAFLDDWAGVAWDEALHHRLLSHRLAALGAAYGDLVAHDGLWQAAHATAHDLTARLAVVPMVLEARGLDVTPGMIARLSQVGDIESAQVLHRIHDDEIGHVAVGKRWFHWAVGDDPDPQQTWRRLVRQHFGGQVKPPFNEPSRNRADFPSDWYLPLVDDSGGAPTPLTQARVSL